MNDLLDEISNEVELDSKLPDPATEIAARLARLKDEDKVKHLEQPGTVIILIKSVIRFLDSKLPGPATEIAARLARLKGEDKNNQVYILLLCKLDL